MERLRKHNKALKAALKKKPVRKSSMKKNRDFLDWFLNAE